MRILQADGKHRKSGFTLVEAVVLLGLLFLLGLLIAWGIRRTNRVASLKALRDLGVTVSTGNDGRLEGIQFANCFLGDEVLVGHVANLGTFQFLTVPNTDIGDDGVKAIPDPDAITALDLTLTGISDESLRFIGEHCHHLNSLNLTATLISDDGVAHLSQLPELNSLNVAQCRLTDRSLATIAEMKSLTHLDLSYTSLSRKGFEVLSPNVSVKDVRIAGAIDRSDESAVRTLFPNAAISFNETMVRSSSPRTAFSISRPELTDGDRFRTVGGTTSERNRRIPVERPAVQFVQNAGGDAYGNLHITRVDLTGARVTDDDIARLYPFRLIAHLQLSGTQITDRTSRHLAGFRHLEILQLAKTSVADDTARVLPRLPLLREVDLRHTQLTDAGMKHLARSERLLVLDVSDTAITDKGLSTLLTSSGNPARSGQAVQTGLRVLGLSGTLITDASIDLLTACQRLQEVSVGRTKLSSEGLARLRREFPGRVRLQFLKFHPAWPVEASGAGQ